MHGYAETEVFSPNVVKAREMIESGAIGEVLSVRAREAHSGPHAAALLGRRDRPAAARCSTWAATRSRRRATSSARTSR